MLGNVLRNSDVHSDAGGIRKRAAGSRDVPTRSAARDMGRFRVQAKGHRGKNHLADVDRYGFGYFRQPRPNRLAKGKTIVTVSWTQYIPHHEVENYERLGWTIRHDALAGTHHGDFAVLGTWRSDNPDATPPKPAASGRP